MKSRKGVCHMSDELEIMLKSHDYLRQEILNSVNWQNRILIATAGIISVLLGLGLTVAETLTFSSIIIPPAVTILTAYWLVEQSRMMRAGNYLQLLENEINIKAGGASLLWENWLRGGMAGTVHRIHHISQYFAGVGVFYIISAVSLWNTITLNLLPWWVWGLYIAMLIFMLVLITLVVQHKPKKRGEFEKWKNEYEERLRKDVS